MRINTNVSALNTYSRLTAANASKSNSLSKLSSGLRINKAGDDAAGLAISEKMKGQIGGLSQAKSNAQDGISLIQTAEGALNETHSILQRMRELAIQAGNDTNTKCDREEIQKEMNQLTSEINRIGNTTEFNTQKLLDGNRTGEATKVGDKIAEVLGEYTIDFVPADDFKIGTTTVDLDSKTIDQAVTALNANTTLNVDYKFDAVDGKIKITQLATKGNATAPEVTGTGVGTLTTIKAGAAERTATEDDVKQGKARLQVGANANQSMVIDIGDMRASALGITDAADTDGFTKENTVSDGTTDDNKEAALSVASHEDASKAVKKLDEALNKVSSERSKLGAMQNRLEHTINNLGTSSENLTAAESRIRDVDMAKEMMTFSKNNILSQAAQAMLAQANQQPQGVLQLLR